MGIDPKPRTADRLPESRAAHRSNAVARSEATTNKAAQNGNMRIQELSAKSRQMHDERKSRVEALALAIREGRYSISPEQIARSILSNMVFGFRLRSPHRFTYRSSHER
jgi:flagellar biosynthesis anti-sigma factor FlgM